MATQSTWVLMTEDGPDKLPSAARRVALSPQCGQRSVPGLNGSVHIRFQNMLELHAVQRTHFLNRIVLELECSRPDRDVTVFLCWCVCDCTQRSRRCIASPSCEQLR